MDKLSKSKSHVQCVILDCLETGPKDRNVGALKQAGQVCYECRLLFGAR